MIASRDYSEDGIGNRFEENFGHNNLHHTETNHPFESDVQAAPLPP
jgi:hypothetical protein